MDIGTVKDFGQRIFDQYANEEEAKKKFLFAKALQNNSQLNGDVHQAFFSVVNDVCSKDNHLDQKCAFRKTLIENIKNMVMWQEYFKRNTDVDGKVIFKYLKGDQDEIRFEEFEKQSAYFQLYSEALYTLIQSVLNRFYDEEIENNYSIILAKTYRLYYQHLFDSITAQSRGTSAIDTDMLEKLKDLFIKVEEPALRGEELVYDINSI